MICDSIKEAKGMILRDESLFTGSPDSISQPETVEDVCDIVKHCRKTTTAITVRGGLTAMNGAGVSVKGHSMSVERLNQVTYDPDSQTLWAQAGATFQKIEQTVRRESAGSREFAAAPTEKTATVGGALSFATSGIRALRYGTVAQQVLELEYCDSTGNLHTVRREDEELSDILGSEGMYAVITGVRLATTPVPGEIWGLIFFLDSEKQAGELAGKVRNLPGVTALEYMDGACLELLKTLGRENTVVSRMPALPAQAAAALYMELEAEDEAHMEEIVEGFLVEAEEVGADPDLSWTAVGEEVERFRDYHHALQECINRKTAQYHNEDAAVTRLTWPVCAPMAEMYRKELAGEGLETAVFGHWDESLPLGIHIFARNGEQYRKAKAIMARWYQAGAVVQPHRGIGKVYRDVFDTAFLRSRKAVYDPDGLFNPGNG